MSVLFQIDFIHGYKYTIKYIILSTKSFITQLCVLSFCTILLTPKCFKNKIDNGM